MIPLAGIKLIHLELWEEKEFIVYTVPRMYAVSPVAQWCLVASSDDIRVTSLVRETLLWSLAQNRGSAHLPPRQPAMHGQR